MAKWAPMGYRHEARQLRREADELPDGRAKRALQELGRDFDALAWAAESRLPAPARLPLTRPSARSANADQKPRAPQGTAVTALLK